MARRVKSIRYFGGKQYNRQTSSKSKKAAEKYAENWRAKGHRARVVKSGNRHVVFTRAGRKDMRKRK